MTTDRFYFFLDRYYLYSVKVLTTGCLYCKEILMYQDEWTPSAVSSIYDWRCKWKYDLEIHSPFMRLYV